MEICPVISTEQAHTEKYGPPRECYEQALKQDGPSPEELLQLLTGDDCGLATEVEQWRISN